MVNFIVEGKLDKVVLEILIRRLNILPIETRIQSVAGQSNLGNRFRSLYKSLPKTKKHIIFIVRDLDDREPGTLKNTVQSWINEIGETSNIIVKAIELGLRDHKILKQLGVNKFAIDDYLLCILLESGFWKSLSERNPELKDIVILDKLFELRSILVGNGIEPDCSKQYMNFAQAVLNKKMSDEKFAEAILLNEKNTSEDVLKKIFNPIIDEIEKEISLI